MARVTSIRPQGRTGRRVAVALDDGTTLTIASSVAREWGLSPGQELGPEDVRSILLREQQARAMARAMRLLGLRPRSEAEIRRHLARRRFGQPVAESTIARLRELGHLDDAAFARYWREARDHASPRGAQALRRELLSKGVSRETVEQAVGEGLTDEESAYRAAEKRLRRLAAADYPTFRKKLTAFLAYRGFSTDVIRRTVQRAWEGREG